jgi:hypothetical protein
LVKVLASPSPILPSASMSQSGIMVAALLGGFVVFLAMQGKLGNYWSILLGGGSTAAAPASTNPAATPTTPTTPTTPSSGGSTAAPTASPFSFLGGTSNPTASPTGGTGSVSGANAGAAIGVPNISMSQFFGLQ